MKGEKRFKGRKTGKQKVMMEYMWPESRTRREEGGWGGVKNKVQ